MRVLIAGMTILLIACSSAPSPPKTAESHPPPPPPRDESAQLPLRGRLDSRVIADKLLGKPYLPGGTLADYQGYQLFLARTDSAQQAAFLLLDFKKDLADAKYLAHMGGYFGMDGGKPIYVFAKGPLLAGVIGLPREEADRIAREFAARLR